MKRHTSLCSLIAMAAMLGLAGCGGSGSDTTQDAATDPAPVSNAEPSGEAVTITGQVTDAPIANARVVVTVDGNSFEAPATTDALGNFEVTVRSANPDALVLMEAFDPATGIHFTALLDDFGGFSADAGADGTVRDKDITNVTTAHYVLARDATDDGVIDDRDELDEMAERVDTAAVLELSAAIKLVVENLDGVTLPPEFDNTQSLAEAIIDGSSRFLDDVSLLAPDALNDAIDRVVNDGHATLHWNAERVPGVYLHRDGFSLHAMFSDRTGIAASLERDTAIGFQWSVDENGKLLVVYDSDSDGHALVTLLSRHRNVLSVMVEELGRAGEIDRAQPGTARYFPFADRGFTNDSAAGTYSTMGEPGHVKVLLAEHTGYDLDLESGEQSDPFIWEVDSHGVLHLMNMAGVLTNKARVLGGASDGGMHLLVSEFADDGALRHLDVITVRRSDRIATSPGEVSDANIRLAGSAYAFIDNDEVSIFRFRADGALRQVSQQPGADGADLIDRGGEWEMIDDQTMRTRFSDRDEAEDVRLLDGIGADRMLVQTAADLVSGTERVVTRIRSMDLESAIGAFYILDSSGSIGDEVVILHDDFTGEHYQGSVAERFEWTLNENGSLVVTLPDDGHFDNETLTLHLLAGGTHSEFSMVVVRRVNGRLAADEDDDAITLLRMWREG